MRISWVLGLGLGASAWAGAARAETDCVFLERGRTLYLQGDCQTDATLPIPDGFTLDGRRHRITARDPAEGGFAGAVIRNAGNSAHVRNLILEANELRSICDPIEPVDTRLRGILLQDASGTIVDNEILAVNQGASGCQEGSAIEVRVSEDVERRVSVRGNRIRGFQKTGIAVLGAVAVDISSNRIEGQGPIDYIAQNGIQVSDGAHGSVRANSVSDLAYIGETAASGGILVMRTSGPLEIALNRVQDTDVGIWLSATSRAAVRGNIVESSTYDGIALEGSSGPTQYNRVVANYVSDSASVGIDLYGAGVTYNLVAGNRVCDSGVAATQEVLEATNNLVLGNACEPSLALD